MQVCRNIVMRRCLLVVFLYSFFFVYPALSAEFKLLSTSPMLDPETGECNIQLTGVIRSGDVERLEALLNKIEFDGELAYSSVCLNSPGGNYVEGVKIAKLLVGWGTATVIRDGAKCLSACAIAFMGGSHADEGGSIIRRFLHVKGQLGFHAPYLNVKAGKYNKEAVNDAYFVALSAVSELMDFLMLAKRRVGGDPIAQVKPGLVKAMLQRKQDEFYYIDDVGRAGLWHISLIGAKIKKDVPTLGLQNACENLYHWRVLNANHEREMNAVFPKTVFKGEVNGGVLTFHMQIGEYEELTCRLIPPNGVFKKSYTIKLGEDEFDLTPESMYAPRTALFVLQ